MYFFIKKLNSMLQSWKTEKKHCYYESTVRSGPNNLQTRTRGIKQLILYSKEGTLSIVWLRACG